MVSSIFNAKNGLAQAHKWGHALISSGVVTRLFNSKPIWAQLKITDRCNLQCGYCSEYKKIGDHVDIATVSRWLRHCSQLGVKHVEFIGGEPLVHPDLIEMITLAKKMGINSGLTTNGFLLTKKRADELLAAGICRLQLSIDCIEPNSQTRKAFELLMPQLNLVGKMNIWVHVNSVLTPETLPQAKVLAEYLFAMGIPVAFSPAHIRGRFRSTSGESQRDMIEFFKWLSEKKARGFPVDMPQFLINYFTGKLAGESIDWTCEGGCKAFYVDSDGRFCLCSHKSTGLKFEDVDDGIISRNHHYKKGCETECGVACMVTSSFPYNRLDYVLKSEWLSTAR